MGQSDVYKVLKNKGWKTKMEIVEELEDFNISGITACLGRLVKGKFVEVKEHPTLKHGYLYRVIR